MHPFYNEPGFWGFLTAIVASTRWLIRVIYLYFEKSHKLELSFENLKNDNAIKILTQLQNQVKVILPMISRHEEVVENLQRSVDNFMLVETNMTESTKRLDHQYAEFNRVVPNITTAVNAVVDDIFKIKTEIIKLKDDYLFITTKKERKL